MKTPVLKVFFISAIVFSPFVFADITLNIDLKHPGDPINKNAYGQFMEHLGRGIYEGIWVGEDSPIPLPQ